MNDLPKLIIRVTGPSVGEARLAASDLAEIIRRTQQALQRVGQVLYGQESLGKGRKKKDIEELCQLFVVAWEKGSSIVSLELARPTNCNLGEDLWGTLLTSWNKLAARQSEGL